MNVASGLGYLSTAVTFFPIGNLARPYFRWLGLVLIIVGVVRGAQSVIAEKNKEIQAVSKEKDAQIEQIRTQKDGEIVALTERVAQLSRKPYAEELGRVAKQLLDQMTYEGKLLLTHLLKYEPIEVGHRLINEIPSERENEQLAIAYRSGIVRHHEERHLGLVKTSWVINPQFRPVLEDLLYE